MEKKTKQRILGIVVVIALVIVLLPFLQSGKEVPAEAMLVKAPPFPDQSVQVNATNAPAQTQAVSTQQSIDASQNGTISQVSTKNINPQPDDTIKASQANAATDTQTSAVSQSADVSTNSSADASVINATITTDTTASSKASENVVNSNVSTNNVDKDVKTAELSETSSDIWSEEEKQEKQEKQPANKTIMSDDESAAIMKKAESHSGNHKKASNVKLSQDIKSEPTLKKSMQASKHVYTSKAKSVPYTHTSIDSDGLMSLKNAAWVIQVGSFKSKTNALRLVNQLRSNGYKAFIQQFASNTRVFVGPEIKQGSARALASRLESEMKIRGIVLSYKPLAL